MILPDPSLPWPVVHDAVAEIAFSECGTDGPDLVAYLCPAKVPTIGWGETEGVHLGDTCTKLQADQWLLDDLVSRTQQVQALLKVPTSPNELGGLVVFAYNVGVSTLAGSTVLKCHNKGDKLGAARAFDLWNKFRNPATKQLEVSNGLTARRKREAALYLKTEPGERVAAMPQAVEGESSLSNSPIAVGGVASTAAGSIGVLSEMAKSVGGIKEPLAEAKGFFVDVVGLPTELTPYLIMVAIGVAVWYWRNKQRAEGWA